jgi:protein involved in polysaccharide export with SLBB domain
MLTGAVSAQQVPPVIVPRPAPTPTPTPAAAPGETPSQFDVEADDRTRPVDFGDVLDITVPRYPEFTKQYAVGRDGSITLDIVGSLNVKGLTAPEVEQNLTTRLAEFVRHPEGVVVHITARRMIVRVLGHVELPGPKQVPRGSTVQEVLSAAGGVSVGAVLTSIVIRRNRDGWIESIPCDLKAYLEGRGTLPELDNGDEIFVPRMSLDENFSRPLTATDIGSATTPVKPPATLSVLGAVRLPGEVAWQEGGSLLAALALAGGTLDTADLSRVRRIPGGRGQPEICDLQSFLLKGGLLPTLRPGDVVVVPLKDTTGPMVRILGAVLKPTTMPLGPQSDVQQAVTAAGGNLPTADLHHVVVLRRHGTELERFEVDLEAVLRGGDPATLGPLEDGDTVFVPQLRSGVAISTTPAVPTVFVLGQVTRPGPYPLSDARTPVGALALAGGALLAADMEHITITHPPGTPGERSQVFDLRGYQSGAVAEMPALVDGDIIEVDTAQVTVVGEVLRVGPVPIRSGANLIDAIAGAGGPTVNADLGRVTISRREGAGSHAATFNLRLLLHPGEPGAALPAVRNGDVISVETMAPDARAVLVLGSVLRPGPVSVPDNGSSLLSVIAQSGGVIVTGDPSGVHVLRGGKGKAENVDLRAEAAMPQVFAGDVVMVDELGRPGLGALVVGGVTRQGWVSIGAQPRSLMDVIGLAGGVAENASLSNVRLIHANGEVAGVNLVALGADGGKAPLIRQGDIVIIGYKGIGRTLWDTLSQAAGVAGAISTIP